MDYGKRVERIKEKAFFFLKNNIKAFIKDYDDNYYFADIIKINETHIFINNFNGKRKGENSELLFIDIKEIDEYKIKPNDVQEDRR